MNNYTLSKGRSLPVRQAGAFGRKIGLDLRLFGTAHGGIGRYCEQLFPRLLKLDKANQYFAFVNSKMLHTGALKALESLNNCKIVETNARHYSFGEQLSFLRLLNKYKLDLVHFPNFNMPIFYKRPFVVTIHDMVHHKISGAKKSHLLHFLAYKKVIETAGRQSKKIITVSQASKKDISNFLQIPNDKIEVIYEAASLSPQIQAAKVLEIKKSYLLSSPYFLFVGVLERKKNLINLTRGFDYFLQKYKLKMDLVLVGKKDPHYPDIKHKAMDIKHKDNLVFADQVDDEELAALYSGAYAFTSASLHEGFGLPGVEALSFGLPLLASNIEVFNEIYDNAAMYFNPLDPADIAEKMNLLARDKQFYEQMSKKSLERAQKFGWDEAAAATLEVYKQIL